MADKIKVALDSSNVINLFTLIHPKNDLDGKVMKGLETKTLNANDWTNLEPGKYPPILRDKFLGLRVGGAFINLMDIYNILTWIKDGTIEVYVTPTAFNELENLNEVEDGKKYYSNLMDIYRLLERIKKGIVELYITPSVFGELNFEYFEDQLGFIKNYFKVIQVKDEDAKVFYSKRGLLAKKYVESGAMLEQYNASQRKRVPQNDAYIMAEASLCGLVLITANNKDFINATKWKYSKFIWI